MLSRTEVSQRLRALVESSGVDSRLVASHSLRRGSASLWSAAGMSDERVMQWGRWNSMAYKLYVHLHDEVMREAVHKAAKCVPRYELN